MSRYRTSSKLRRTIETLLLVSGLIGLGIWGWSYVRMALFQKKADQALQQQEVQPKAASPAPAVIGDGALLGRLSIPRLHVHTVVREGVGEETLDVSAGHIPGTALPGQAGNVGVAAHRDTLFRALRNIKGNDLIEFQTQSGTYDYKVVSTQIVTPSDVTVLRAGLQPTITLVTCYPFYYVGPAPRRFIVKARLVSPPPSITPPVVAVAVPKTPAQKTVKEAAALKPRPVPQAEESRAVRRVEFRLAEHQTRDLPEGIRIGLSSTDASRRRVNGWMWVSPSQRAIWLHDHAMFDPIVFHGPRGDLRELMITDVTDGSASGYLLMLGHDVPARAYHTD